MWDRFCPDGAIRHNMPSYKLVTWIYVQNASMDVHYEIQRGSEPLVQKYNSAPGLNPAADDESITAAGEWITNTVLDDPAWNNLP